MCGICGLLGSEPIDNIQYRTEKMASSMTHRGPDARGVSVLGAHIALGQQRLSIIDLDARSNQPFAGRGGSYITYNGEIYNFRDIAAQLSYPFRTRSDTEVLIAAIEEKGIDWALSRANGMFAFAHYDPRSQQLILARDRMGIKPLYYCFAGSTLVFASEIKGILASGLVEAVFNEAAVDEYLGNRYVRAPYTFFKNIFQVMPGHYLRIAPDLQVRDVSYWTLPAQFNMEPVSAAGERRLTEAFEEQVVGAIRRRMISDVPLGTYLSGGVDSSLITAVAALDQPGTLNTYTIGFPEMNEFDYAALVADRYHTRHHQIVMDTDNYFGMMEDVIWYKDAPLGVPNEIPLARMSKKLKEDITVVLSGEGADELMGGYGRIFRSPFDYERLNADPARSFYDYFIDLYEYVPRTLRDRYLAVDAPLRSAYDDPLRQTFAGRRNEENVFRFFHEYHVKGLLQRVDTTTMLASVEARVPFLDHTLLEFCYREIPYGLKLAWRHDNYLEEVRGKDSSAYSEVADVPKYLLRQVARKYLPDSVIDRKKLGFPVPLDAWISQLTQNAHQLLRQADWLKRERLDEMLDQCRQTKRAGQTLWMFINIELFRKKYFTRSWRY